MSTRRPFDAVLVISFGGPQGLADIRPFLANVLARSPYPAGADRGGRRPLRAFRRRVTTHRNHDEPGRRAARPACRCRPGRARLRRHAQLASATAGHAEADGRRRREARHRIHLRGAALVLQLHAVQAERRSTRAPKPSTAGMHDVEVTYVEDWHEHDGFVDSNARHVQDALAALPEGCATAPASSSPRTASRRR